MIKSLTPQQEAKLPAYAQKWLDIGLSTEPCNVTQTKRWINRAYKQAGLEPPKEYKLFDSPLSCAQYQLEVNLSNQVKDHTKTQILDPLRDQVHDQVCSQVWSQVWDQVSDRVRIQVRSQVWNSVWGQVYDQVWKQVWTQVSNQTHYQLYGNHDAHWLGLYDFLLKELKLDCVRHWTPLINLAKHCGWWRPYKEVCLIQHRPKEIHFNSQKQLHKDGGPALSYRDGFSLWRLNGVETEEMAKQEIVTPERAKPGRVRQERELHRFTGFVNNIDDN